MQATMPGGASADASISANGKTRPRVLTADDNPVNLQIAVRMLEKLGCEVGAAVDGLEAVRMQESARYDLIILDWQMPGLDGPEAASRIRSAEQDGRRVPIIGLTAAAPGDPQHERIGPDIDELLHKPLRLDSLQRLLERWLQLPSANGDANTGSAGADGDPENVLAAIRTLHGPALAELVPVFIADGRRRMALMRAAIADDDSEVFMRTAHALAGSCGSLGAQRLARLGMALESYCRSAGARNCKDRLDVIDAELSKLEPLLAAAVAS